MLDLLIEVPYVGLNDGYGQSSLEVIMMLAQFCDKHELTWGLVPTKLLHETPDRASELRTIRGHTVQKTNIPKARVLLRHNYPFEQNYGAEKVVTYTMFETDKCPPIWVNILNASDLVLVPYPSLEVTFGAALKSEVRTLYLPLRREFYEKVDDADFLSHLPKRFTMSVVGTINGVDRKAIKEMIDLFVKTDIDADLLVKTRSPMMCKDPRVNIISRYFSTNQLIQFYLQSHVGVYPSRGEGYGLPQIETSFMGRPVVLADNSGAAWSGRLMPWSYLAPCEMRPAEYNIKQLGTDYGNWGYVNWDEFFGYVERLRNGWINSPVEYQDQMVASHAYNPLRDILAMHNLQGQLEQHLLPLFGG
jgi:hypothetical protein